MCGIARLIRNGQYYSEPMVRDTALSTTHSLERGCPYSRTTDVSTETAKSWKGFKCGRLHWPHAWPMVVLGAARDAVDSRLSSVRARQLIKSSGGSSPKWER